MRKILLLSVSVMICNAMEAQVKVATSAGAPHSSAILEIQSTSKGLLLPRMTTAERAAISSPATGLAIYNTTLGCIEVYNGTGWGCMGFTYNGNPAALGSTFTSFSNGTAMFSTNATCSGKMISAGYNSTTCSGSVTVGSNSYNMVHINGQCWMQTNLKEAPSNFGYNNTWLNTGLADLGRWGYYHTTVTNGSSGFQSAEPDTSEGYLYQWSAAMNNSSTERAQGVCPTGWHVPSDCEWMYLEHGLGMTVGHQTTSGDATVRSSGTVGSDLSTLTSGGTNSSGFTGLLAGFRSSVNGGFSLRISASGYTSSSSSGSDVFYRGLFSSQVGVLRNIFPAAHALSVRCLRD